MTQSKRTATTSDAHAPPSATALLRRSQQQQQPQRTQQYQPSTNTGNARSNNLVQKKPSAPAPPVAGPSRLGSQSSITRSLATGSQSESTSEDEIEEEEEEEEEEMALQMDGQDLWNQNYCSVCDCLIEPGAGVGPSTGTPAKTNNNNATNVDESLSLSPLASRLSRKNSSAASSTSSGVHSSASTIKPRSSEGRIKRDGSSGKLANPGMKRTGSAGSRLNALSDLKPTTKLNGDANKPSSKATAGPGASNANSKLSPKATRRSSSTSIASVVSEPDSLQSQPSPRTSTLPRSKKGGLLLGGVTPAVLKQQEEEEANRVTAPPALYCSERCRDIDQQSSLAGLSEFGFYANQQAAPISPTWIADSPTHTRDARKSSLSSLRAAGVSSKTSEIPDGKVCTCIECQEKISASGTVPSGASDTTEGSGGYPYARTGAPAYRKQRSQSGRIITPQNLIPPSGGEDGYFPRYTDPRRQVSASYGAASNQPTVVDDGRHPPPERTASAASGDTGRSGTGSSAQSTGSYAEFWEPKLRTHHKGKGKDVEVDSHQAQSREVPELSQDARTRESTVSGRPRSTRGSNEFTATASTSRPTVGSLPAGASPLKLLRRKSNNFRASPFVDVSTDLAHSPSFPRGHLAESFASEQTLGTSAKTLVHREPSLRERRKGKCTSLMLELPDGHSRRESPEENRERRPEINIMSTGSLSKSYSGSHSNAMEALKAAAPGTSASSSRPSPAGRSQGDGDTSSPRRNSSGSILSSASSGFLKGLSSAWTAFRGAPPTNPPPTLVVPGDDAASSGDSRRRSTGHLSSPAGQVIGSKHRGRSSAVSDQSNHSGLLSKSAASESLSRIMSGTQLQDSYAVASPTSVTRPGANRGSVPAFAKEIGQGSIPGEANGNNADPPSPPQHEHEDVRMSTSFPRRNSSALCLTNTGSTEEERRRRRKAEQRHQRSKDVTMLPPLLAPSNRTGSSANLAAQHRSRSRSRSAIAQGPGGAMFTVGSLGSIHDTSRPMTPSLITARAATRSPEIALNDVLPVEEEEVTPLPWVASQQDLYRAGSSPGRRSGLGWGAMTPITPLATHAPQRPGARPSHGAHHHLHHYQQHPPGPPVSRGGLALGHIALLGHHPHGSQSTYGRHSTMPVRSQTPIVPEHGGEMSAAALTGQDVEAFYREAYTGGAAQGGPHSRPHSAIGHRRGSYINPSASNHPHHASTTSLVQPPGPSAMGPPRPRSSMAHRHSSYGVAGVGGMVPPSPVRGQFEPLPERTWSYDNLAQAKSHPFAVLGGGGGGVAGGAGGVGGGALGLGSGTTSGRSGGLTGVKTYSVLTVPGREETHDRYDETWNHVVEMLAGDDYKDAGAGQNGRGDGSAAVVGTNEFGGGHHHQQPHPTTSTSTSTSNLVQQAPIKRKQLFHFGP